SSANFASAPISLALTATRSATCAMPGFPGAQNNSSGLLAFFRSAQTSACSLPPEPTIRILISLSGPDNRSHDKLPGLESATQTLAFATASCSTQKSLPETLTQDCSSHISATAV